MAHICIFLPVQMLNLFILCAIYLYDVLFLASTETFGSFIFYCLSIPKLTRYAFKELSFVTGF